MVTKKKTNKSSMPAQPESNVRPRIKSYEEEYYFDMFSFRLEPVSHAYIEKFAMEWVDVVSTDESIITLEQFFVLKRVTRDTVKDWLTRSEVLRQAKAYVLMILSVRREVGSITKKYDSTFILRNHAAYDPTFKLIEEWRAKLSADNANALGGTRVIMVEKFENVPTVKPSKSSVDE
jgi:hypothetical protein